MLCNTSLNNIYVDFYNIAIFYIVAFIDEVTIVQCMASLWNKVIRFFRVLGEGKDSCLRSITNNVVSNCIPDNNDVLFQ